MKTETTHKTFLPTTRVAAILGIGLLLAGAIFLITPQGRAWAQELLRFFTRAASDTVPAPTAQPLHWINRTPGATTHTPAPTLTLPGQAFFSECGDIRLLKCSVDQVRAKVSFPIKELGDIPDGIQFTGATGSPNTTWIVYDYPEKNGRLLLIQEPWMDSPEQKGWMLGASAAVETVKIGQVTGEYVKGSFSYKSGETQQHWDANADVQTLRWEVDGIFTVLEYVGDDTLLDRDGLAALAASLTTTPTPTRITSIPATPTSTGEVVDFHKIYPLTIPEAEQQAGFHVLEVTHLPDILSFVGASCDNEPIGCKIVTLFYLLDQNRWGPNTNGIGLREQMIHKNGTCALCGIYVGPHTETRQTVSGWAVGENATIQVVQIGSSAGQYVEGVWNATNQGILFDTTAYVKTLRWQANGIAFELTYFGEEITQKDMIKIAESVK